jgi:hypothetical protein
VFSTKKITFHTEAHNLRLSRLRPPLPYRGSIFFFTSGNRRTIIGRTAVHPASYRAPALPQALPPSVRHRSRDPSNSGKWLHLLSHRHALTPISKGVFGRLGQPRDSHLILAFHTFGCLVGRVGSIKRFPQKRALSQAEERSSIRASLPSKAASLEMPPAPGPNPAGVKLP